MDCSPETWNCAPLAEEGERRCCDEFSSVWQPRLSCWSLSHPLTPNVAAGARAGAPLLCAERVAAVRSLYVVHVAVPSCAAVAVVMATVTVSLQPRQSARPRSARRRRAPITTMAAATTPTATTFARAGTIRTERNAPLNDMT